MDPILEMDRVVSRVVRRFARAQLSPLLKNVEHVVRSEDWRKAEDELRAFGKVLGIFPLGGDRMSIRTEWFSGLDNGDKHLFLDFAHTFQDVFNDVYNAVHYPQYFDKAQTDDHMDTWFESLHRELPTIQEMMRDDADAYTHGKFKIIPLKGVTDPSEAVETLDKASELVRHKFPEVLYGKVYVRKDLRPKGTHDPRPGSGGVVAGAYTDATDIITLSMYATPERNSLMTLIHEFGHRYGNKFLKGDVEYPAREDQRGVYASEYGETSWEENFAESFLAFVLGKPLPKPLQQFMESL